VPLWRPSTTGRPPEKRHLNLKIVAAGIRDFGADQGYTPIDLVMAACECDLDTAFKFLAERLGFGVEVDVSGLVAAQVAEPELKSDRQGRAETSADPKPVPLPPQDDLEAFTHPPGLVGEIIDWVTATSRRPNRVLSLGAAITVVGTLIGRRVAGPTNSATHLYVVSIALSGGGKGHVLDSTLQLMHAAKADAHIGPSRFHSGSAVFRSLETMPVMLAVQDEFGGVLRAITDRKAGSFDRQTGEVLRALWGISFKTLAAPAWATRDTIRLVRCPAMSILGFSTPNEFLAALQGESVDNGLLNRFLVLPSTVRVAETDPSLNPLEVPQRLADDLNQLYLWSGPESLLHIGDPEVVYSPEKLTWASARARFCYDDFGRVVEEYINAHAGSVSYLARCVETSIRLATIRAAGRWGRGARVDVGDMEWGAGIAWKAAQGLAEAAQDYLPQNERSETGKKLVALIRRRGVMRRRDIQRWTRCRLDTRQLKDILAQLVEAGEIEETSQGYRFTAEVPEKCL
jgi:hypothetical protein